MKPNPHRQRENGFSLIEVMVAMSLACAVLVGLAYFTVSSRSQSTDLSASSSCYNLVNGITAAIKAHDNAMTIRNWLPSATTGSEAGYDPKDPLCSREGGRHPVCDSVPLVSLEKKTSFVDFSDPQSYQNIRGAFTWAQSLYNTYRTRGICDAAGMTVTPQFLRAVIPGQLELPAWATEYSLYIKDSAERCGNESSSIGARLELRVTARYRSSRGLASEEACTST
ncbi:MAG TPA: prepilin-type N-terminal cleavage/methylation domain-containing protein, partial [Bdellovibrionales bacterium]|nr:prepilin-type N-terminal cleavage/methylation domain-containing protein [Bdellovibrionales bacterium]